MTAEYITAPVDLAIQMSKETWVLILISQHDSFARWGILPHSGDHFGPGKFPGSWPAHISEYPGTEKHSGRQIAWLLGIVDIAKLVT